MRLQRPAEDTPEQQGVKQRKLTTVAALQMARSAPPGTQRRHESWLPVAGTDAHRSAEAAGRAGCRTQDAPGATADADRTSDVLGAAWA